MRRGGRAREAGFTLLEVLVALVIIGVALSASMRGVMALTGTSADTRMKLLATMAAENRVIELRLARQRLEVGQVTDTCAQGGVTFICDQAIKSTPNPFFRRVEIRVRRPDLPERVSAEMMTILPTGG
jgi:general secretion pathway protein I